MTTRGCRWSRGSARLLVILAVAAAGVFPPAPVLAQEEDPAGEGAIFLLLPVGPRAVGMGRSVTAFEGAESVWWNPAGLAELGDSRFLVYRAQNFGGEGTAATVALGREGLGSLAFSYQLMDFGSQPRTDDQGNSVGTVSAREHLAIVTMATRIFDRLNLGVNMKMVQDRFTCRGQCPSGGVTGTTFALDGGMQISGILGQPLRLAALVVHAGPALQIENAEQADPLPTRFRLAAAYEVLDLLLPNEELDLWLSVEVDDRWREPGTPAKYLGSEFRAGGGEQILYLRAGYTLDAQTQVDGAAVGLGLRYENFDLGIAKSLSGSTLGDGTEPAHISFGFVF